MISLRIENLSLSVRVYTINISEFFIKE
jgi:hypothetical protein